MRSLAFAVVLVATSSLAVLFAREQTRAPILVQSDTKSQKTQDAGPASSPSNSEETDEPAVILRSESDKYGTYNASDGTRGPFWSAQGIWNASTRTYTGMMLAAGSTVVSGFANTRGLLPGMFVAVNPDVLPPETTIVSVEPHSIIVSNPAKRDGAEAGSFGLVNDGTMFRQTITNLPRVFPSRTKVEWSYPAQRNDASVYSYAIIGGYGIGTGGYIRPLHKPPPKKVSEFTDLSVTYDVSVSGNPNDFAFLIETYPTTASDPLPPKVANTMTNEIGFFPHVPNYLWTYVRSLENHFDYSSPDGTFHAYIASKPGIAFGQFPPYTMIVPVTEAGGRMPRDMMTGPQTLPLLDVLRELVSRGIIPSDSYVCGFDLGFEIGRNSGQATLNSVAWRWQ
jgi:hypothetical protein